MKCLACDTELDGHLAPDDLDAMPDTGDLSMCIYCGALAFYTRDENGRLGIRVPTGKEHYDLMRNDAVIAMLRKRREVMSGW